MIMEVIEVIDQENQFQKAFVDFYRKNLEKDIFDLTFVVSGERIRAQRYMVAVRSEVFHRILYEDKPKVQEIVIPACDYPKAFACLVEFCMTGRVEVPFSESVRLIHLAEEYKIENLRSQLFGKVMRMISEENCFDTFRDACLLKNVDIEKRCRSFFESDPFKTVLTRPNLPLLSRNAFEEVLLIANFKKTGRDDGNHMEIFDSIVRWSKGNAEDYRKLSSAFVLKYVDFKKCEPNEVIKIGESGVLGFKEILFIQNHTLDNSVDISKIVPNECSTLSTLKFKGKEIVGPGRKAEPRVERLSKKEEEEVEGEEEEEEPIYRTKSLPGTCQERNLIGRIDVEYLLKSKDVETDIHVPYNNVHDGGACFDPKNGFIWSHYGKDEGATGKKIYCTDIQSNTTISFKIPFQTHGSYPIFDPSRELVYVFECPSNSEGKRIGSYNKNGLFTELRASDVGRHYFSVPSIHFDRIWHITKDHCLCYFDIQNNKWVKKKSKIKNVGRCGASFHEYLGELWIVDDKVVYKYSMEKDEMVEVFNFNLNLSSTGNYISFSLLTKDGFVVCRCMCGYGWVVIDPFKKKIHEKKTSWWTTHPNEFTGHWFLSSKTKELYFNVFDKWRKVSLVQK